MMFQSCYEESDYGNKCSGEGRERKTERDI